jgi:3-hydroxybutyryl-CoA dehydrogenase
VAERLRLCIINEATLVNEEGTASPEAIDTALTLGMNHPRGPFQMLADLGPVQVAGGLRSMVAETGDARYRASQWLLRKAAGDQRTGEVEAGVEPS